MDTNQYFFLLLSTGPSIVLAIAVVVLAFRERKRFLALASIGFVLASLGALASAFQSAVIMIDVNSSNSIDSAVPPFADLGSFIRWAGLGGLWLGVVSMLCHAFTRTTRRAT